MLRHHVQKKTWQTCSRQPISLTTRKDRFPRTRGQQRNASTIPKAPKLPLKGTLSIITGASRGIGQAIATNFARNGSQCLLIGRDARALQQTLYKCINASLLASDPSATALPLHQAEERTRHAVKVGDVSSRNFWTSLQVRDYEHGSISRNDDDNDGGGGGGGGGGRRLKVILVNAAGISHSSLFVRTTDTMIESVIATNLVGTLWASQALSRTMVRRKMGGVIINIASLLATHGGAGSAAYVASKAGVVGLTRSLAAELGGSGIRVNAVLPGYIVTDMTRAMSRKAHEDAMSRIPLGRFGHVDEVAEAAFFLATNAYANNCILNLDGGLGAT